MRINVSTFPATVVVGTLSILCINSPKADAILLIGNSDSNNIIVFDEQAGNFLGNFTTPGNGGLRTPDDLTFGPDGNLYVSSGGDNALSLLDPSYPQDSAVLRFSSTGEFWV
jgi:DNA-binding beta-propeller fold protein YncE